jgi:hypothetical protein
MASLVFVALVYVAAEILVVSVRIRNPLEVAASSNSVTAIRSRRKQSTYE